MNNSLLQVALFAVEQLLKYAPSLFVELQSILARTDVTVEEIRAKRDAIANQKFEDLVPNSELPPED